MQTKLKLEGQNLITEKYLDGTFKDGLSKESCQCKGHERNHKVSTSDTSQVKQRIRDLNNHEPTD